MKGMGPILAVVLTGSVVCVGCGDKPKGTLYQKAGKFSYDPPAGWKVVQFPGLKYRVAKEPVDNGFAANINVVDETFSGSVAAYVDSNLENLEKLLTHLKVLTREDFKTRDNKAGVKMVITNEQHGRKLRQTMFFLGSRKAKYVITCTALADGGESLDASFAQSTRTFRFH